MNVQSLLERLKNGDVAARIETLRIIAMVEETEALPALSWVFKNDPDPQVRQVAQWTGSLVWQAQQRGHSTQEALKTQYKSQVSADREALFLDGVASGMIKGKTEQEAHFLRQQERLTREMLDTLHDRPAQPPDVSLSDLATDLLDEE
jgi:hypothetical protein